MVTVIAFAPPVMVKVDGNDIETAWPPSPLTAKLAASGAGVPSAAVPSAVSVTMPVVGARLTVPLNG